MALTPCQPSLLHQPMVETTAQQEEATPGCSFWDLNVNNNIPETQCNVLTDQNAVCNIANKEGEDSLPYEIEKDTNADIPFPTRSNIASKECEDSLLYEIEKDTNADIPFPTGSNIANKEGEDSLPYEIEKDTNADIPFPTGRRYVDIGYFFGQIFSGKRHDPFDCSFIDMKFNHEKRFGLQSTFIMECRMCKKIEHILSDNPEEDMDINKASVLGAISTGIGYTQLSEQLATINMPTMSYSKYTSIHNSVSDVIHDSAWKVMKEAGKEEAKWAKEQGQVDSDGNPLIAVIADGAWSKRSYRTNYDASSGVACIIGARTEKILFLGIKNKYCTICARAENESKDLSPDSHTCFKNWTGTSTSMESSIIVEGFKQSMELHGLKFNKLIGDGDSSVQKKLLEVRPYGTSITIKKIECKNHLLRNYCNKLRDLSQKRTSSSNKLVSPFLRKCLKSNILRLRVSKQKAIAYRSKENVSDHEKIIRLENDISNSINHVFGDHSKCANYFCKGYKDKEENKIPAMRECGLYEDIMACCYRLIHNADSLIANVTNNPAELYNSIVCKFIGGKRVNFAKGRSYSTRCEAAAISYNLKANYHHFIHNAFSKSSPGHYKNKYVNVLQKRQMLLKRRKKHLQKNKKLKITPADRDYGRIPEDDMLPHIYEKRKNDFLNHIKFSDDDIQQMEFDTRGQFKCDLWHAERAKRITASKFGDICKLRPTTSCANIIKSMLYGDFYGNRATKWGSDHEQIAIRHLQSMLQLSVSNCGLIICKEYPYLGASPDGLIDDSGIVEVKCPFSAAKFTPEDAHKNGKIKFTTLNNGQLILKRTHTYYYQVQGQLYITKRQYCYFVIWTPLGMSVEKIFRDEHFWTTKMQEKLEIFYMKCLLPELIDPRFTRDLDIRNPPRTLS